MDRLKAYLPIQILIIGIGLIWTEIWFIRQATIACRRADDVCHITTSPLLNGPSYVEDAALSDVTEAIVGTATAGRRTSEFCYTVYLQTSGGVTQVTTCERDREAMDQLAEQINKFLNDPLMPELHAQYSSASNVRFKVMIGIGLVLATGAAVTLALRLNKSREKRQE
jgi:hypothetical protein